jgi:adenine/guanine/hypoxanthine permease
MLPEGFLVSLPPSLSPIAFQFDFSQVFTLDMLIILFTFLFVDMFDTVGTLIGVSSKADMIDKDGKLPRVKQALFADALAPQWERCWAHLQLQLILKVLLELLKVDVQVLPR